MAEFTILDRDRKFAPFYYDVMFDARLKLQTRTVLMMMLSRRDGWDYSVRGMAAIAVVANGNRYRTAFFQNLHRV